MKIETFISFLKKNNYSKNTITTYKNILNKYKNNIHDIRILKKTLLLHEKSPNTIWTHYNVICSYMKFARDKRIREFKQIKLPKIHSKYMPIFSKTFLLNKTSDLTNYKNVIIRFLFETGIRACELKQILEIGATTIVIKGKGNKIREIFHKNETTKLFKGFTYSEKTLRIWVKEVLGKEYTPHSIRRSHATHMLLNGANPKTVMMQLGHSKVETTYRYLQLSLKRNRQIYNKYF